MEKKKSAEEINKELNSYAKPTLSVHLMQDVEIHEKNRSNRPVEVHLKREYDTIFNCETGELPDPKFIDLPQQNKNAK